MRGRAARSQVSYREADRGQTLLATQLNDRSHGHRSCGTRSARIGSISTAPSQLARRVVELPASNPRPEITHPGP